MTFTLNAEQQEALNQWLKCKPAKYAGAIGGRFVYTFCPTSIGCVVKVRDDMDGDEIDLSDYENW